MNFFDKFKYELYGLYDFSFIYMNYVLYYDYESNYPLIVNELHDFKDFHANSPTYYPGYMKFYKGLFNYKSTDGILYDYVRFSSNYMILCSLHVNSYFFPRF